MAVKRKAGHSSGTPKKSKASSVGPAEFQAFYANTMELVNELKVEDKLLVAPFLKLPSKKLYPDYLEVIERPVTIGDIQKHVAKNLYSTSSTDEFVGDFKLMLDNAAKYNDPDSWIVEDAQRIYDFVQEQALEFSKQLELNERESLESPRSSKQKSVGEEIEDDDGNDGEPLTLAKLPDHLKILLNKVIEHEFPEDGVLSGPFIEDVDRKEYPEYFEIIKNPTSFNKVRLMLEKKKLFSAKLTISENLDKFHDAVMLIFKNAQEFNHPDSLIHQDAVKLQTFFEELYSDFSSKLEKGSGSPKTKLKLKLVVPKKEKSLKLTLKGKSQESEPAPKKKDPRGRKKKAVATKVKVEEEIDEATADEDDDENVQVVNGGSDVEMSEGQSDSEKPDLDTDDEYDGKNSKPVKEEARDMPQPLVGSNVLGKGLPSKHPEELSIQQVSIVNSVSNISGFLQQVAGQEQYNTPSLIANKNRSTHSALFPSLPTHTLATFFDYRFPTSGYSQLQYTLSLPSNTPALVNFKVCLHPLIQEVTRSVISGGLGAINALSEEEFQCQFVLNDEEVNGGALVEQDDGQVVLNYDVRFSFGLNILVFYCKLAPSLSKRIKTKTPSNDTEELQGRHTRHQLQQLKMSWDVEKFTLYVVRNNY